MNKQLIPIVGVAGLVLSGASSHAGPVFNYTDGDLILDFSQSGSSDLEIDIGSLANLNLSAGGGTLNLGNFSTQLAAAQGVTLGNLSLGSLSFSVFGQQLLQSGSINAGTVYLTQAQPGANPITPPTNLTGISQATVGSKILAIEGLNADGSLATKGILPWSAGNSSDPIANSASEVIISTSTALVKQNSYSYITSGGFTGAPSNPKNTTPGTFTSGSITSDLFTFDPAADDTGTPSVYDGQFTFNSDGSLDFTPVPEPGTYGLLAAGGAVFFALRRQFIRKQA
jgi:hypothetical protein